MKTGDSILYRADDTNLRACVTRETDDPNIVDLVVYEDNGQIAFGVPECKRDDSRKANGTWFPVKAP